MEIIDIICVGLVLAVIIFLCINNYNDRKRYQNRIRKGKVLLKSGNRFITCQKQNGSYCLKFEDLDPDGFIIESNKFTPEYFCLKSVKIMNEDPDGYFYLSSDGTFTQYSSSDDVWFTHFNEEILASKSKYLNLSYSEPKFEKLYAVNGGLCHLVEHSKLSILDQEIDTRVEFHKEYTLNNHNTVIKNNIFTVIFELDEKQAFSYVDITPDPDLEIIRQKITRRKVMVTFRLLSESKLNHCVTLRGKIYNQINKIPLIIN